MCLACFSSPAEFLNYWMVKGVKFLSRLLNASCSDVITVPLFFSLPPIRPRPLSSFNTYASWQPVTESAQSRWSYGKIEDYEQSIFNSKLGLHTWKISAVINATVREKVKNKQTNQQTRKVTYGDVTGCHYWCIHELIVILPPRAMYD